MHNLSHQSSSSPKTQHSRLTKLIIISSSLCIVYLLLSLLLLHTSKLVNLSRSSQDLKASTSIDHLVFGIASNHNSWPRRKDYVKLWWRPHQMRGCVFLENMSPSTSSQNDTSLPPVCLSDDTNRIRYLNRGGLRSAIRVARVVSEIVAMNHSNVRWFVFGDDDTVFFPENLVKTLSKYDHELWYYIGKNSEVIMQNKVFSFDMAFGGAGFALSYPLAKVLAKVFESCLERYTYLYGSDGRVQACVSELGIGLTREPGFHQMDIRGNMFGLLAAHPNTPVVSMHHLDFTDPIFPNMTTTQALEHLLEAAKVDPHRLLQQTVCYDRWFSWTVSVSWGYAVQVFGNRVFLPDVLRTPQSFIPWKGGSVLAESYIFDTREYHPDPCRRPVVFFFDRVDYAKGGGGIKSSYRKMTNEDCAFDMGSPRKIEAITVLSQKLDLDIKQRRRVDLHAPIYEKMKNKRSQTFSDVKISCHSDDSTTKVVQIYTEARQRSKKLGNQYEAVWLPIMNDSSTPLNEEKQKQFQTTRVSMLWFSVSHPSMVAPAFVKHAKDVWHFDNMMRIWGSVAFPFTSSREEQLWEDETWATKLPLHLMYHCKTD
ncbi:unnamed protein product [Camellia sinensis]